MPLRRVLSSAVVAIVALAVGVAAIPSAQATGPHYYLALGDSLSVGYMPGPGDTDQGYTDKLFAQLQAKDPSLVLVKLGCSGETTGTMINGGRCSQFPDAANSQLSQAEAFLRAHAGEVSYLTLDIGANDVDNCASGGSIDPSCVTKGIATIAQNLETILDGLVAADHKAPRSAGMTYYDPFLASWLSGTQGQLVAAASVPLLEVLNSVESTLYLTHGFKVADVGAAFKSTSFFGRQNVPPYGSLPINVAYICRDTFMCSVGNIHANDAGYQLIADTFARKFS